MKKVNKFTALIILILVAITVSATLSLVNVVTANTKLRNEVKAYKSYYKSKEEIPNNDSSRSVKGMKYRDSLDSLAFSKHVDLSNIDGDNFYSREINEDLSSGRVYK